VRRLPYPVAVALLLLPGVGFLALFFGTPLGLALVASVTPDGQGASGFTLDHYRAIFTNRIYLEGLVFSIYLSVVPTLIALAISLPLAVALQSNFPGKRLFRTLYQLPLAVPTIVAAFLVLVLLDRGGLVSRMLAPLGLALPRMVRDEYAVGVIVAMVWKAVPFMTLIIAGAVASIQSDVTAAARSLGASRVAVFFWIELPMALPGITAATLLVFVTSTGAFAIPSLLGPIHPEPLSMQMYKYAFTENRWGIVSAMGSILSLVACVVLLVYYRLTARIGGGGR
jgi:putative spermidine/putrescine transport system permease protein